MSLDICIGKDYSRNITHNVTKMWDYAGCYDALYNSDGLKAKDIKLSLENALIIFSDRCHYEKLKTMNPSNGWGDVTGAMMFLIAVYIECCNHPKAKIRICK